MGSDRESPCGLGLGFKDNRVGVVGTRGVRHPSQHPFGPRAGSIRGQAPRSLRDGLKL